MKASLESVTAAAASVKNTPAHFRVSITNAPGKDAYPISSFTWLLIPTQWKDAARREILADFLNSMIDDGQKMTAELTHAPLPENAAAKVKTEVKEVWQSIQNPRSEHRNRFCSLPGCIKGVSCPAFYVGMPRP